MNNLILALNTIGGALIMIVYAYHLLKIINQKVKKRQGAVKLFLIGFCLTGMGYALFTIVLNILTLSGVIDNPTFDIAVLIRTLLLNLGFILAGILLELISQNKV